MTTVCWPAGTKLGRDFRSAGHARRALILTVTSVAVSVAASAAAQDRDVVLSWNEIAQQTVATATPFAQSLSVAMMQLAVLEALEEADNPTVADAAAMTAAHGVLRALHPNSAATLDAALAESIAGIADQGARREGSEIGRAAAVSILADRESDGSNAPVGYTPRGVPGSWAPTPPAFAPAAVPHWGGVTPFVLDGGDQFRPGPPAAIDSPMHLADLREVLLAGSATSEIRTEQQSDAARFWIVSAVQGWNSVARQLMATEPAEAHEAAFVLARLNTAIADALIACFDAKYAHDSWRPVTAIQAGVVGDATDWLPLIPTPAFPAYPSAHACAAGAAATVLEGAFGDGSHDIVLTSPTAEGVVFRYTSLEAIADQIDDARVFGGLHTREDQAVGRLLGARVGQFVIETLVRAD